MACLHIMRGPENCCYRCGEPMGPWSPPPLASLPIGERVDLALHALNGMALDSAGHWHVRSDADLVMACEMFTVSERPVDAHALPEEFAFAMSDLNEMVRLLRLELWGEAGEV